MGPLSRSFALGLGLALARALTRGVTNEKSVRTGHKPWNPAKQEQREREREHPEVIGPPPGRCKVWFGLQNGEVDER